jgi:hypothetical protein
MGKGKSLRWSSSADRALSCPVKLSISKALSLRLLPHDSHRKASEVCQVGSPRAHKEVSSVCLEAALRPFVGTGLIVAIAKA